MLFPPFSSFWHIYLLIYYNSFDFNVFKYISVNSIIKYSLNGIGVIVLFLLGLPAFKFVKAYNKKLVQKYLTLFNEEENKLFEHLLFFLINFINVIIVTIPLYLSHVYEIDVIGFEHFTFLLTMVGSLIIAIPFINLISIESNFKSFLVRTAIYCTVFTICIAFHDSLLVKTNMKYQYVRGEDLKGDYTNEKFKLIGNTGNHYFLKFQDEKGVIIKKFDDFKELHVKTFSDTTNVLASILNN